MLSFAYEAFWHPLKNSGLEGFFNTFAGHHKATRPQDIFKACYGEF